MTYLRYVGLFLLFVVFGTQSHAQDSKIKIEKFTHSPWTKGIFSEDVTLTTSASVAHKRFEGIIGF